MSRAVLFIIVISHFNQQRIIAIIAVCPDMILLRMACSSSTLGSVYIHITGDICIRRNSVSTVFLRLPAKEFIRTGRRISRELISNFFTMLHVDSVVQGISSLVIQLSIEIDLATFWSAMSSFIECQLYMF